MESKYFTPDIEDIHIGYECELLMNTNVSILNPTSNAPEFKPFIFEKNKIELLIKLYDSIRVPYLTKKQIEAEGWKHTGGKLISGANQLYEKKEKYSPVIIYSTDSRKIKIEDSEGNTLLETVECKDINTFRLIQKLLGIK